MSDRTEPASGFPRPESQFGHRGHWRTRGGTYRREPGSDAPNGHKATHGKTMRPCPNALIEKIRGSVWPYENRQHGYTRRRLDPRPCSPGGEGYGSGAVPKKVE